MTSSHPPSLLALATRTVREEKLIERGNKVLIAVSGGPDSMALLHVLAWLRPRLGHTVLAHGVDHGLRPEAGAELDGAEAFARSLEVPFERTRVKVAPGGNIQARARTARYEALRAAAARQGASAIATAHHLADRAETVLLRLLRGAGPRGLAVLPPRAGDLIRPFLRAPRTAIDAHLARHGIPSAHDPSNRDPRYLRVRVRHELLPLLRSLSPGIEVHLCALADQLGALDTKTDATGAASFGSPLSRASRQAITALLRERSPRARVALKHGRTARWDEAALALVIEPPPVLANAETRPRAAQDPGWEAEGEVAPDADARPKKRPRPTK
jgi:tRNA(Ile)-lysidine synthase